MRIPALVLALPALLIGACNSRSDQRSVALVQAEQKPPVAYEQLRALGYNGGTPSSQAAGPPAAAAPEPAGVRALDALWEQQKLIREAQVEIEVEDVDAALARIEAVAAEGRGFVAGRELRRSAEGRRSGSVTLKSPSGAFDATLAGLQAIGEVRHESTSTQDVTKAYADLETRLAVKRRTKERLDVLLASRTGSLADLLQVERELERVVTEIERMEGEKRYYDQRIAVSTITISLFEPGAAIRPGILDPIAEALREAVGTLAISIAALIYAVMAALPWVFVVALLWFLVRRWRRRRAAARAGATRAS